MVAALVVGFALASISGGVGAGPPAPNGAPAALAGRDRAKDAKLESRLVRVARKEKEKGDAAAVAEARRQGIKTKKGKVRVVVVASDPAGARSEVAQGGGDVEAASGSLVQALVPAKHLEKLARHGSVRYVRPAATAMVEAVGGEEVATSMADTWHALGRTGAGTKVAVIDLGFQGFAAAQASGDLPASLTTIDYCGGIENGESHGVAVAEIVHEMAPGAALTLICIDSEVALAQAEAYLEANGIKIVNHSVGWFNTSRGDSSGAAGSPAATVAKARSAGILWVNSAGNYQQRHWSGTFNDPDNDNFHNFPSGETSYFWVPSGGEACVLLKWDSWPTTAQDYDVYVANYFTGDLVAAATNVQNGTQMPTEDACFVNPGADDWFYFVIDRFGASLKPRFDVFLLGDAYSLQYRTTAGSINELAASASSLAVGAMCWANTGAGGLESFSSLGPTIDGRIKPDITGYDAVSGTVYGSANQCASGFFGTSAASPNVAGAAALALGVQPSLTVDQLQTRLTSMALDVGTAGKDNSFGAGRLRLTLSQPTVSSITPAIGPVGTVVTVAGTNLGSTTGVMVNGVAATPTNVTATSLKLTVPPGASSGPVQVTTLDGTASSATTFKVTPKITSLSVTSGIRGSTVVLTGTTFTGATAVKFGAATASFTVDDDSHITATVPATAVTGNITVTTPAGTSPGVSYTVVLPPATTLLTPSSGPVGTVVTVTGTNLAGATGVSFGGTTAGTVTNIVATSLKATVPAGAQTGPVQITNPAGTGGALVFKVTPKITSLSVASGIRGSTVVLTGTTFTGATAVKFGAATAAFTVDDDSHITATVPNTATTGNITVTTPAGTSPGVSYTVILPPTTSLLTPSSGPVGTVVTVTGTNLAGATGVSFGGTSATTITNVIATSLKATVPAGAQTGAVQITNPAGTGGALTFKVTPKITSLSVASGIRGSTVVLTGTTFTGTTSVKFGAATAAFTVDDDSHITATVPNTAVTGNITVTTPAGTSPGVAYTVVLPPTTTLLTPSSGPVGTVVTVTGTNLAGATGVTFGGIAATTITNVTATSLKATVPAGAHTGVVMVSNPAGTGGTLNFKVAPRITGLSPTSGTQYTRVTITGDNFTGATAVKFNGTAAFSFTVDSDTQITAIAPANPSSGNVQVVTPDGSSAGVPFTFVPPPVVTSFSPASGSPGTVVTLNGQNLGGTINVRFGITAASSVTIVSPTQIRATVPVGATTDRITVTTPGGSATSGATFTLPVTLVAFHPWSGGPGTLVTLWGDNFLNVTSVKFGDIPATFSIISRYEIHAVAPPGVVDAPIAVGIGPGAGSTPFPFTTAPPSGGSERIVYATNGSGLRTMDGNGGSVTVVTTGTDYWPGWSPSGTKIAFNRAPNYDIWVVNSNGTGLQQLTSGAGRYTPRWSPDGTKIAFLQQIGSVQQIGVMNADGSDPTIVTNEVSHVNTFAWNPDGTEFIFPSAFGSFVRVNADGTNRREVPNLHNGTEPEWSPDGAEIRFRGVLGISAVHPDGTGTRLVAAMFGDGFGDFSWGSCDRIVFEIQLKGTTTTRIGSMDPDGTRRRLLTPEGSHSTEPDCWQAP